MKMALKNFLLNLLNLEYSLSNLYYFKKAIVFYILLCALSTLKHPTVQNLLLL